MKKLESVHEESVAPPVAPQPPTQQSGSGMAVASMVLGILSVTGFGLILGIPAIILGAIALKKSPADRGLSWTGIITGAISTIVSLLILLGILALILFAMFAGSAAPTYLPEDLPTEQTLQIERT